MAEQTLNRISDESVREATGRGWDEWLTALDNAGAAELGHRDIVGHLEREHPELSGWWRQSITVTYEKARGKRVLGQTADAGFQVGVQRTVALGAHEAWELIVSRPDIWLGGDGVALEKGAGYEVPGARGEIRVVKPGDRLRLTWQPDGWAAPATLQLTLSERSGGKTAIGVHLEKLPDAEARSAMREHWRGVLDRLTTAPAR